jgi:hypothetical protein
MRREDPPIGTKCCHWFFYEWENVMWHSKGKNWLSELKFPSRKYPHSQEDAGLALGLPSSCLPQGQVFETKFEDGLYNIPVHFGKCLDVWYPLWNKPAGGSSKKQYVMRAGDWNDKKTWVIF